MGKIDQSASMIKAQIPMEHNTTQPGPIRLGIDVCLIVLIHELNDLPKLVRPIPIPRSAQLLLLRIQGIDLVPHLIPELNSGQMVSSVEEEVGIISHEVGAISWNKI